MKTMILTAMTLISALATAGELSQRTYTFQTDASYFTCGAGVRNNGHNYPTDTVLTFDTAYGVAGILGASKIPLNNTQSVALRDSAANPCSYYADLLQATGSLNGQAVQNFSNTLTRTGTGECFKVVREDLTITVFNHVFSGSNSTYLPMADTDCP